MRQKAKGKCLLSLHLLSVTTPHFLQACSWLMHISEDWIIYWIEGMGGACAKSVPVTLFTPSRSVEWKHPEIRKRAGSVQRVMRYNAWVYKRYLYVYTMLVCQTSEEPFQTSCIGIVRDGTQAYWMIGCNAEELYFLLRLPDISRSSTCQIPVMTSTCVPANECSVSLRLSGIHIYVTSLWGPSLAPEWNNKRDLKFSLQQIHAFKRVIPFKKANGFLKAFDLPWQSSSMDSVQLSPSPSL